MALSATQMAQLSHLLDEALGLDEVGRRHWLRALPPEHQDLAPALRKALLTEPDDGIGAGGIASRLGSLPPISGGTDKITVASSLHADQEFGPYRLVHSLGRGGMAEVWLAQRADGAFKRNVAIKVPLLARLRKDLASRFAHERGILAGLEHANIARLYDAGVAADGTPYLAIEYVQGMPITDWCDSQLLGIPARLTLFAQVLDAVQYAHERSVIHRDIKPSNILVTRPGQVRLLDFGVAKLLAGSGEEQTQLTTLYGRALTPEYASPEFARGEAVDATSDVYSLGVLLYELIAGSRPYRIRPGTPPKKFGKALATTRIDPPSERLADDAAEKRGTTPRALAQRVRGDLDAIVLKALAREPAYRYPTARALAGDLQCFLDSRPVHARAGGPAYRLGKFLLRHRRAAGGVGATLFAASAVAVVSHFAGTP